MQSERSFFHDGSMCPNSAMARQRCDGQLGGSKCLCQYATANRHTLTGGACRAGSGTQQSSAICCPGTADGERKPGPCSTSHGSQRVCNGTPHGRKSVRGSPTR